MSPYWDYAKGKIQRDEKGYTTNRMPLWIKPDRKVDVLVVMDFMRDHLEGTELDMSKDPGAGPYACPYRWRPMTFTVDGKKYVHERATATQQTGFTFVSQSRNWLPNTIGGILWFGVDDAANTVYFPMYSCATRIPHAYAVGNGSMMEFTTKAAFWVFNQVSNLAIHVMMPSILKFAPNKRLWKPNIPILYKSLTQEPTACMHKIRNWSFIS